MYQVSGIENSRREAPIDRRWSRGDRSAAVGMEERAEEKGGRNAPMFEGISSMDEMFRSLCVLTPQREVTSPGSKSASFGMQTFKSNLAKDLELEPSHVCQCAIQ